MYGAPQMTGTAVGRIAGSTSASIASSVEAMVRRGDLAPGTALPTIRKLADTLQVSTVTVADAYRTLRLRGLVRTDGRRGTTVADRPSVLTRWSPTLPPAGQHNLVDGNPDPELLPPLGPMLARADARPTLYGEPRKLPELESTVLEQLRSDGMSIDRIAIVGGAIDGIGQVLDAQLAPGDRVAVEDPTFPPLFDLLAIRGLEHIPVPLDENGPIPDVLEQILDRTVKAVVITSRAQNPTGALVDAKRSRRLRTILRSRPDLLVIEDDTGGTAVSEPLWSVIDPRQPRWAFIRSYSMVLGPDLRTGVVAADEETLARVEGRHLAGTGWVSHILQRLTWMLLTDRSTLDRIDEARRTYDVRRTFLIQRLAARGIHSSSRAGFNVWVEVPKEAAIVTALQARGWWVAAGEPFRLSSPPAIRITASRLSEEETEAFVDELADVMRGDFRAYAG
jgi:DNA-binding transcriptional MocR family regulator